MTNQNTKFFHQLFWQKVRSDSYKKITTFPEGKEDWLSIAGKKHKKISHKSLVYLESVLDHLMSSESDKPYDDKVEDTDTLIDFIANALTYDEMKVEKFKFLIRNQKGIFKIFRSHY